MSAGSSLQDRPGLISEEALHKRPSPGNRVAGRNILIHREARLPGLAFGLEPVHKLVLERSCRNFFLEETLCFAGDACDLLRFLVARASVWMRGLPGLRVPSAACAALPVIWRVCFFPLALTGAGTPFLAMSLAQRMGDNIRAKGQTHELAHMQ